MDETMLERARKAPSLFDLTGKVAMITGGDGGLGRGMGLALAAMGADIVPISINRPGLESASADVRALGRRALPLYADITCESDVESAVQQAVAEFGQIDILINSAGTVKFQPTTEYAVADWDRVLGVNLKGAFITSKYVGRVMVSQKRGKIINMSSVRGLQGRANDPSYPASKGGLNMLTKSLAIEWAPLGITVNAIAPTFIRTEINTFILDDPVQRDAILDRIPMGRIGQVWDLFGAAVFLASAASDFVTGHILYVDGGWTAA
jgi:NAD(P)-dependent dehydrogenase (short-subunit alcohol dehydrogenase family)